MSRSEKVLLVLVVILFLICPVGILRQVNAGASDITPKQIASALRVQITRCDGSLEVIYVQKLPGSDDHRGPFHGTTGPTNLSGPSSR